jgi:hypothetical protein
VLVMSGRPVVLVSGAIANKHLNGGEAWVRLNWLLGLRRLGCDVYFVEQIRTDSCVDEAGEPAAFEVSANAKYFSNVMREFGLAPVASLLCQEGHRGQGLAYRQVLEIAEAADVLINISGHLTLEPILRRVRRKAYIDLDPGFTQFWHAQGSWGSNLGGHDFYFTVGENIGTAGCPIPTCGVQWRRKRRFCVLERWPVSKGSNPDRFTTVAAWRGSFGPIEHDGRRFGLKVHEFRKVIPVAWLAPQSFEIALSIHPADRADLEALENSGWRIVDPRQAAGDPLAFRRYVQGSGAEFSAAQGIYVDTSSGWLSDRTIRYLATGKPALVQDTGFGRNYPVGEGLVPFRTLAEAVRGARRIARDYDQHSRAARALAETYFNSDIVLPEIFEQMGIAL